MNVRFLVSTMVAVAVAACGGKKEEAVAKVSESSADAPAKWLKAAWKPVEVELGDVKVKALVPEGLPANDEYMLGKDWWVGVGADIQKGFPGGPRLTLDKPHEKSFDPETLARDVEPDAKRADLVEIAKEALPGGRVRYVSATNGNHHIDVTVWIPLADPAKGVRCNAHWYVGSGADESAHPPPPDPALVELLKKFCDSVQIAEATPPAAPPQ